MNCGCDFYDSLDEEVLREECIILSDALDQAIDEALEVRRQSGIHPNGFRETPEQMRERLCKKALTDNYKTINHEGYRLSQEEESND